MTELSKLFSTVLLLAAGFFGASMFGPPELTERLIGQWATPQVIQGEGLRPLPFNQRGAGQAATHAPAASGLIAPASATPARVTPRFTAAPLPAPPAESTNTQSSAWQTPDFAVQQVATHDTVRGPMAGPSADFNAWLGAAENWLDREGEGLPLGERRETALASSAHRYQHDRAVAPVADFGESTLPQANNAWLPPRDSVAPARTEGPSLFAAAGNERAVDREPVADDAVADDAWAAWGTNPQPATSVDFPASLGPSPLDAPRRTYEAGYTPVARAATQVNYGTHVVTDGDTLPNLAKRYLGDAARAEELYQLNRDRLDHPDLLPIGLVLRMPDEPHRKASPPVSDWSQQRTPRNGPFSTVSSGAEFREEPSRLVPIGDPAERPARLPNAMYADEWSW